jgi:hypothetical protein
MRFDQDESQPATNTLAYYSNISNKTKKIKKYIYKLKKFHEISSDQNESSVDGLVAFPKHLRRFIFRRYRLEKKKR